MDVLASHHRFPHTSKQLSFLETKAREITVHYAGDIEINRLITVSIVGTREVSAAGRHRAERLARELVQQNIVIMSGLARGVDTAALNAAMTSNGRVTAVIGTPLDKAYPNENALLQEIIYRDHLLISPFAVGTKTFRSSFPQRNRVMAALSDATVIVEASDTSGTLHQAAECQRLGRWLFIMRSVAEDPILSWPASFLKGDRTEVLESTDQLVRTLASHR